MNNNKRFMYLRLIIFLTFTNHRLAKKYAKIANHLVETCSRTIFIFKKSSNKIFTEDTIEAVAVYKENCYLVSKGNYLDSKIIN